MHIKVWPSVESLKLMKIIDAKITHTQEGQNNFLLFYSGLESNYDFYRLQSYQSFF